MVANFLRLALVALIVLPQGQEPFNMRPTDVTVVMSTSRGLYDGTYTSSQVSKICGVVPKELNFSGVPAFLVNFPDDAGNGQVQDVTFDSKELVGNVTKTTRFYLSVSLQAPRIGSPYPYVLDTSQPKMTGSAIVATPSPGTTTLTVRGVNDRGETVDLTLTCKPRKG